MKYGLKEINWNLNNEVDNVITCLKVQCLKLAVTI